jgi:hypothetical protein
MQMFTARVVGWLERQSPDQPFFREFANRVKDSMLAAVRIGLSAHLPAHPAPGRGAPKDSPYNRRGAAGAPKKEPQASCLHRYRRAKAGRGEADDCTEKFK